LQLPDRGEEGADDGLGFGGLAGNQLFGDLQRHALQVGEKQASGQTDSPRASLRAVADYVDGCQADTMSPLLHGTGIAIAPAK
jgi:hypothetical protein